MSKINVFNWISSSIKAVNTCPVDTPLSIVAVHAHRYPRFISLLDIDEASLTVRWIMIRLRRSSNSLEILEAKKLWLVFLLLQAPTVSFIFLFLIGRCPIRHVPLSKSTEQWIFLVPWTHFSSNISSVNSCWQDPAQLTLAVTRGM